jgi:hypothetical protein
MVATGICVTVIEKDFDAACAIHNTVDLLRGSVGGTEMGTAVITLPGTMVSEGNRYVGYGPTGVDIICMPAKGP